MPQLLPFRALRYDAAAVPDLSAVLCPPYDVISGAERELLAARDPRNAIHVELPISEAGDAVSPYEAAARTFSGWIADGTLRRDERQMIYVYEQRYQAADGSERAARGFFARLRLEPYGSTSGVLPHEHTLRGPKEDRFRLMSAVQANLSPVLFLYDNGDQGAAAEQHMEALTDVPPEVEALGPGGLINRLWVADPAESDHARELMALAASGPLTIADGHHRYETALRYRDQPGAPNAADFVLGLLYDARSGGLGLLPWHRVFRGVAEGKELLAAASEWFAVTPCRSSADLVAALVEDEPSAPRRIGLWTPEGGALLEVDREHVAGLLPASASERLRWLDVTVLSSTLSRMIGSAPEELATDGNLTYVSDASTAVAQVESGAADVAFLLRPTPIEDVIAVAAAGEHMPAKSTFFHPKAATGLVFNPLAD
ncbi:MAG: DUF1015 domain-containing protein [Candidatus Limnocylindrales bacterium]